MSDSLPVITIPATMAEKVKTFGNLTYKVADIKQIVEATLNYFVDELSEGRSITIPKMMKLTRELRKARDFHVPGDKTKTTSKPARYSLKATIATATKDAIEKIPVDDAEKVVESDAEEVEKVVVKPTKAAAKPKATKATKAKPEPEPESGLESEPEVKVTKPAKGRGTKNKAQSEIEPDMEPEPVLKPVKPAKPSKPKSKAKGGASSSVELAQEPYGDIDNTSDAY